MINDNQKITQELFPNLSSFDRALSYPYFTPNYSFSFYNGEFIKGICHNLNNRIPILSVGSNRSPYQLKRKFSLNQDICVTPATLFDSDVVFAASLSSYGSMPATQWPSKGTEVDLNVLWLNEEQLEIMHLSEALGVAYNFVKLKLDTVKIKDFKYAKQIRVIHKHFKEAKGPTFARFLCSTLFADEDYFLQIDSHSLCVKDWDVKCIEMIHALEKSSTITNKKVMLSHYPPSWESYKENADNKYVTHLVDCFFNNHGIISFRGAKWRTPGPLPRRNAFLAGGFIFTRGSWLREVPFDPHLDFLFTGEEILLSARSYTFGWDVYTPNQKHCLSCLYS